MATSRWITSKLVINFKDCPDLDCEWMRTTLRKEYGIFVLTNKLYRACCIAQGDTLEKHVEDFVFLRCYALMVLKTNLGGIAKLKNKLLHTSTLPIFGRIFICFNGSATRFVEGCSIFQGFDVYHLK